ncbi:MAG: hypothetical protein Cons2KO_25040 [Congregibacter sp.]
MYIVEPSIAENRSIKGGEYRIRATGQATQATVHEALRFIVAMVSGWYRALGTNEELLERPMTVAGAAEENDCVTSLPI